MEFIIKGFGIGFLVAAPVGPIGILCIKRSLVKGRVSGLVTGIGAATADALYGSRAAFGITALSNFLLSSKIFFQAVGILFLLYLGMKSFFRESANGDLGLEEDGKIFKDYISTFFLTMTNPATILSFLAIFAGIGVLPGDVFTASSLVAGVFIGSSLWWFFLSFVASRVGSRIGERHMIYINKVSGAFFMLFGVFIIYDLIA